jgi:hypothetical protein
MNGVVFFSFESALFVFQTKIRLIWHEKNTAILNEILFVST